MGVLCVLEPAEKMLAKLFSTFFFWNYDDSHLDASLLLEVPVWHGNNQAANPFYA